MVVDMDEGIEQPGRGTSTAIYAVVFASESRRRSFKAASGADRITSDTDSSHCSIAEDNVRNESDREFLIENLADFDFTGVFAL